MSLFYIRPMSRCQTCQKPATDEVRHGPSGSRGVFCAPHAKKRLRELEQAEAQLKTSTKPRKQARCEPLWGSCALESGHEGQHSPFADPKGGGR